MSVLLDASTRPPPVEAAEARPLDARARMVGALGAVALGSGLPIPASAVADERLVDAVGDVMAVEPDLVARSLLLIRHRLGLARVAGLVAVEYVVRGGGAARAVAGQCMAEPEDVTRFLRQWADRCGFGLPPAVRGALADAAGRLFDEVAVLRHDGGVPWPMGTLVDLVGARPRDAHQALLFDHLRDRAVHGAGAKVPPRLEVLTWMAILEGLPLRSRTQVLAHPDILAAACFPWQRLAAWLQGPVPPEAWEAVLPLIPPADLLRMLRLLEEAGVRRGALADAAGRIAAPGALSGSGIGLVRLLEAWCGSSRGVWGPALEEAAARAVSGLPRLPGHTAVVVDVSVSMSSPLHERSPVPAWHAAGVVALALARRSASASVVAVGEAVTSVDVPPGAPVLAASEAFGPAADAASPAADLAGALAAVDGADRLVVLTDRAGIAAAGGAEWPVDAPAVTLVVDHPRAEHWAGSRPGHHRFGALSDAAPWVVAALDRLQRGALPW